MFDETCISVSLIMSLTGRCVTVDLVWLSMLVRMMVIVRW